MALLPDLTQATLYGLVVFLLSLGFLVVFVETISIRRLAVALAAAAVLAAVLVWLGEAGASILVVGVAAALVANQAFEWLTTR